MPSTDSISLLKGCSLDDRYAKSAGTVFITGTQVLVRIAIDQARRDRANGLNTAGFISGYSLSAASIWSSGAPSKPNHARDANRANSRATRS